MRGRGGVFLEQVKRTVGKTHPSTQTSHMPDRHGLSSTFAAGVDAINGDQQGSEFRRHAFSGFDWLGRLRRRNRGTGALAQHTASLQSRSRTLVDDCVITDEVLLWCGMVLAPWEGARVGPGPDDSETSPPLQLPPSCPLHPRPAGPQRRAGVEARRKIPAPPAPRPARGVSAWPGRKSCLADRDAAPPSAAA